MEVFDTNDIMNWSKGTWMEGKSNIITFCITENCNLSCKYCYMTGKNSTNTMPIDIACKAVDFFIKNHKYYNQEAVVWDFVGGEPLIEIDLIDEICDFIKKKLFLSDHPWFKLFRFSMCSNGLLYNTPKVQNFIHKHHNKLSFTVSIDGNKVKHDLQRVKPDGKGSYDDVVKVIPLWLEQFPDSATKATFSHDDLPYLCDSIISLWNLGIRKIAANLVFEDVWHEGDDQIFELQLKMLANYILENDLWKEYAVRFFDPIIGTPLDKNTLKQNYCGAGEMVAVDYKGDLYPCIRFLEFCLDNKNPMAIGNIFAGIDDDKLRPFKLLTIENQSPKECLTCDIASGCGFCVGNNYEASKNKTLFERAIFHCKMHKANVRAKEYFWNLLNKNRGITYNNMSVISESHESVENSKERKKFLLFIMHDDIVPHCNYRNWKNTQNIMSQDIYSKGISFANEHNYEPIFIGTHDKIKQNNTYSLFTIFDNSTTGVEKNIVIFDYSTDQNSAILLIDNINIRNLAEFSKAIFQSHDRINIILTEIEFLTSEHIELYKIQLDSIIDFITQEIHSKRKIECNVLSDILFCNSLCDCGAGIQNITLAPNGSFYICPAFYFDNEVLSIGNLEEGVDMRHLSFLSADSSPLCSFCDAHHCKRCLYLNKKLTREFHIPSQKQCLISHIEREKAKKLGVILQNYSIPFPNVIPDISYTDPFEKIQADKSERSYEHA